MHYHIKHDLRGQEHRTNQDTREPERASERESEKEMGGERGGGRERGRRERGHPDRSTVPDTANGSIPRTAFFAVKSSSSSSASAHGNVLMPSVVWRNV
jgi:hypothetical protein